MIKAGSQEAMKNSILAFESQRILGLGLHRSNTSHSTRRLDAPPACTHIEGTVSFTLLSSFPRMLRLRQDFPRSPSLDLRATIATEFAKLRPYLKPGARIAVGVGSRGITNLSVIVKT